jgi:hypothetical protein
MESQPEFFQEFPQSANPRRRPKKSRAALETAAAANFQLIQPYGWSVPVQGFFDWKRDPIEHDKSRLQIWWLRVLQRPFGSIFWVLEQCIARIQDRVDYSANSSLHNFGGR